MVKGMLLGLPPARHSLEEVFADVSRTDADEILEPSAESDPEPGWQQAVALVRKLHVNTGHASPAQMLRLAHRCQASDVVKKAIRLFQCSVCDSLKLPASHRKAAMPHTETPNDVVGVDFVQVELKREDEQGQLQELKYNVLTCVCLATDFAQQIIVPAGGVLWLGPFMRHGYGPTEPLVWSFVTPISRPSPKAFRHT